MVGTNFMRGWADLLGSLGAIAIVLTAIGLMSGIVKPADAVKHIGAILGITLLLMLIPGILGSAWSGVPLWQQIGLVAVGIGIWRWLRPQRRQRSKKLD